MPIGGHSTFNFSLYNSVDKSHKISHLIQNLNFYKTFKHRLQFSYLFSLKYVALLFVF